MEENIQHFWCIMLCYFKKGKTQLKQIKICAVYGEGAVTDWMCESGLWSFTLDDAPRLGRPIGGDSDQIKPVIENNKCFTKWEIADILKITKSIKLLVKIKNLSFILQKILKELFGQPNTYYK